MTPTNQFICSCRVVGTPRNNKNQKGTVCSGRLLFCSGATMPFVTWNTAEADFLADCVDGTPLLISASIVAYPKEKPVPTCKIMSVAPLAETEISTGRSAGVVPDKDGRIYPLPDLPTRLVPQPPVRLPMVGK